MLKLFLIGVFLLFNVLFVRGENIIGPGDWRIFHIEYKEGPINDIIIDLQQSMWNRTHYVYSGEVKLAQTLSRELGIKIEVCKYVDGGCKLCHVLTDESFVAFVNKYAEENINTCLEYIGVDPPNLPLAKGEYVVDKFLFDTHLLPKESMYGRFIADMYVMKGAVAVGCITVEFEFEKEEDSSDEDDE